MRSKTIMATLATLALLGLAVPARAGDDASFLGGWIDWHPAPFQVKVRGVGKGILELERVRFSGGPDAGAFTAYAREKFRPTWSRAYSSAGVLDFYYTWTQKKRRVTCVPRDEDVVADFVRVVIEEALDIDHETHEVEILKTRIRAKVARDGQTARMKFQVRFRVVPVVEGAEKPRKGRLKIRLNGEGEDPA